LNSRRGLFALTIFTSAFLLFLVQPLIARIILPWFGGTSAVWTTCLMFFQTTLLAGYLYAYGSTGWLTPKLQARAHLGLLGASLLVLPILPSARWKLMSSAHPALHIVLLLAATVGLPYLVLSTTGPLLQAWYSQLNGSRLPYRLYALSNFGSLLALVGYPLVVEPFLPSSMQAYAWSAVYALFVLLCASVAWRMRSATVQQTAERPVEDEPPPWRERWLWAALAACPSALLLAITNHISMNVAPIPLLWVAPLGLYLLSLILCFDSDRWYVREFWLRLWLVAAGLSVYVLFPENANTNVKVLIPVFLAGLFCCCMVCHGELSRRKPAARWVTTFYLMLSLGGAIGGLFVAVIAPFLFRTYLELPIALIACTILVGYSAWRGGYLQLSGPPLAIVVGCAALVCALLYYIGFVELQWVPSHRLVVRNFYGQLRVQDQMVGRQPARHLYHGTIIHGLEFLQADLRSEPLSYYGRKSGVGLAIADRQLHGPVKIGIIGLGAGTLAAYGRAEDVIRFYEINPLVGQIARSQFKYLSDCPSKLDVVLGDARQSLESEPSQQFDVLAVDAFSSDAIPVHLLTSEAFREYFRHLKPDGILAVHITNRYLSLEWVVRMEAEALHKQALAVFYEKDKTEPAVDDSDWMLVSGQPNAFAAGKWSDLGDPGEKPRHLRLWTDEYSNLLTILQ
jgi:SAM-dependent methyltransferase